MKRTLGSILLFSIIFTTLLGLSAEPIEGGERSPEFIALIQKENEVIDKKNSTRLPATENLSRPIHDLDRLKKH